MVAKFGDLKVQKPINPAKFKSSVGNVSRKSMIDGPVDMISSQDKLKIFISTCQATKETSESIEKEFKTLVNSIIFIEKKSELGFDGANTLQTKQILKSLIAITDVSSSIDNNLR